ncbi:MULTISPECIES: SprT family zinc-dependent metalloprotease [unclassified Beijerinckia]|uniref:M48 family metallopeptidase n=1 Tax=unclassified Beijerinckia TaxID=2638183 RepID=UPI001FCE1D95|nr:MULTISPECIES: SprT family zinc-dependent metalloprotease [unclassified Beijerinckia]
MRIADKSATYVVTLKRTAATRRFTLRVRNATRDVVLTIPQRASLIEARDFAEKHAAWIGERLQKLPQPLPFIDGCIVPLRGIPHIIEHRPGTRGTVWVDSATTLSGPALALCVAGKAEHLARRVQDYLRAQAIADLNVAAGAHAGKLGLTPKRISIRDSKTRWGSCSADGSLNFSWRIILAPAFVLDYLAAHEVAHMVHLNHSAKFWALTHRLSADTDRAEAWLDAYGTQLHRYGQQAE